MSGRAASAFDVRESVDHLDISFKTVGRHHDASVSVQLTDTLDSRLFAGIDEISTFFRRASVGWSPSRTGAALEGVELTSDLWSTTPALVRQARSSYFEDPRRFPPGSIELDSAVVMRDLPVSWRAIDAGVPLACH